MRLECEASGGIWKGCRGCFSPIVIDVQGNGFNLTDGNNGVEFDLTGEGTKDKVAWTAAGSDDALLALDRNNNGMIDNALELFGNFSDQPASIPVKDRNGFLALAEFDKPNNGGNPDGFIDRKDAVFSNLRLWIDTNHNGQWEQGELRALPEFDVVAISLDYKESKRTDEFGNRFRYRAKVWDSKKRKRRALGVGCFSCQTEIKQIRNKTYSKKKASCYGLPFLIQTLNQFLTFLSASICD